MKIRVTVSQCGDDIEETNVSKTFMLFVFLYRSDNDSGSWRYILGLSDYE